MARYYGRIGFVETVESPEGSGIWVEEAVEKYYMGTVTRSSRQHPSSEHLNDNLNISNEILVPIDDYASNNFSSIRYIEYMGAFWKINNVLVEHPHLRLTVGGVYNREDPNATA